MRRKATHLLCLMIILVPILLTASVSGYDNNFQGKFKSTSSHEIILDALSWKVFPLQCAAGDTLSGEFILTNNGDIFVGDQTKYDNWLLTGIDFLILNASNYDFWINGLSTSPLFEMRAVYELAWSVETPSDGMWYVIYFNDSIFIKQVDGIIYHTTQNGFSFALVVFGLVSLAFLLALTFKFRRKS